MTRALALMSALAALAVFMIVAAGPAGAQEQEEENPKITPAEGRQDSGGAPQPSGVYDWKDLNFGTALSECPQARLKKIFQEPLDRRVIDRVEQYSEGGDDRRTNEEYSCFPQNETAIDVNPVVPRNLVAGANDYRLGWGTSGVFASTDSGQTWYTALMPFPSLPNQDNLDGGGDPVIAFDRAGIAYYAEINFNRTDDQNGVFVMRSTNGGYTWSRPCITPSQQSPGGQDVCPPSGASGGATDPRQPGDGVVVYQPENDTHAPNGSSANFSVTFHDKEWLTTGRRPDGVQPQCFTPTHTPAPCDPALVGVDRLYATWTAFNNPVGTPLFVVSSTIEFSFSDDQGRSWSPRRTINGNAPFCAFAFAGGDQCDDNQFSVPTTNPHTGELWVAFENFNTTDENQILVVHSADGGQTFDGPYFVTTQFDVNFPIAGANNRPDCTQRGQQAGRGVLTNSCFRAPMTLAIVADKRGGEFADNLHLVMSDNRNGTRVSTNTDVFYFKSVNGGRTWIGPSRVNNDATAAPANRDCGRNPFGPEPLQPACPALVHTGNDQWWPWVDINRFGHLNIVFHDRRLDTTSTASEWPTSRTRTGNYLVWNWGAQCEIHTADSRECVAPGAQEIPQPTGGVNPPATEIPPGAAAEFRGPFHNFGISDFPSNWDYCFGRGGSFCGDYNAVAVTDNDTKAYAHWTDARNGRSSRTGQAGRNPQCEQADVMVDEYSTTSADAGQKLEKPEDRLFDVTPCPPDRTEVQNP